MCIQHACDINASHSLSTYAVPNHQVYWSWQHHWGNSRTASTLAAIVPTMTTISLDRNTSNNKSPDRRVSTSS